MVALPIPVACILIFMFILSIVTLRKQVYDQAIDEGIKKLSLLTYQKERLDDPYFTEDILYFGLYGENNKLSFQRVFRKGNLCSLPNNGLLLRDDDDIKARKMSSLRGSYIELTKTKGAEKFVMAISVAPVKKLLLVQTIILLGIALITVFATIVIIASLVYLLSNPLLKLAQQIEEHAKGKDSLGSLSFTDRKDEVGYLAQRFNHLIQTIKEQSKLASIGQMTTEIAHDIRRPFNNIKQFLALLPKRAHDETFIEENKREIEKAREKVETLIKDLMEFSRGNQINKIPLRLHEFLQSVFQDVEQHLRGQSAKIFCTCTSSIDASLHIDAIKLQRALMNIIVNAIDVLGEISNSDEKKIVEIKVTQVHIPKDNENTDFGISIEITNNGPKIDNEFAKEIFEPFKTRGKKEGTGLGLAIAKNIVFAHEGTLILKNNEEGEVIFQVILPVSDAAFEEKPLEITLANRHYTINHLVPHSENIKPEYTRARKSERVLIIDDEPIFCESVKYLIEDDRELSSLETIVASDGEEVLDLIEQHGISYVISDYRLGNHKLNGIEILEKIKTHKKDIRVLLMSNFRTSEESIEALEKGAIDFVMKPVSRGDIRGLVGRSSYVACTDR